MSNSVVEYLMTAMSRRPLLMGILNVTPDSFSDGGCFLKPDDALRQAEKLKNDGADILDIGGESTRPGSDPVSPQEETDRALPVVERVVRDIGLPVSIDTYKSAVAAEAVRAGACLINDISGLTFDPDMAATAARLNAGLIIMHIKGTPKHMQVNPHYDDVVGEVFTFLEQQCRLAANAGVQSIIIDPGLGFGKRLEDNYLLLKHLQEFRRLGRPVMIGSSRKSFLGKPFNAGPDDRLEGTIVTNVWAAMQGASVLRLHDILPVRRALEILNRITAEAHAD